MTDSEAVEFQLKLEAGGSAVHVTGVQIRDTLNEPYSIEVECQLPGFRGEGTQAICDRLVGTDVELTIKRQLQGVVQERMCGLVTGLGRGASSHGIDLRRRGEGAGDGAETADDVFKLKIAPALEMLRLEKGSGAWHERTYPEVLTTVLNRALEPYGRKVEDKTTQTHKVDLIVRTPDEPTLEFAQRLMLAGGISSFFTHDGPTETLVLGDSNDAFVEGTQYQEREHPFRVGHHQGHNTSEQIVELQASAGIQPAKREFASFDAVGTPQAPLAGLGDMAGLAGLLGSAGGPRGSGTTMREWGAVRPTEVGDVGEQHSRVAKTAMERARTQGNEVKAKTTILGMMAGRTYELELQPGDVRTYVVGTVEAKGKNGAPGTGNDYVNDVSLVPLKTPDGGEVVVRSAAGATEPRMPGLTLAEIVAIENAPVEVDGFLRCRLKFLFDQEEGEKPTTYFFVLQNMAGLFGGTQWIPRTGDRVVVAFLEGRTDNGVILGSIYDAQHKPPYMGPPDRSSVLPESATWLGWNYSSLVPGMEPGEQSSLDRQTMLCMDVTADRELFYFAAPKDWRRDVGNDSQINIIGNETIDIGKDLTEKIGQAVTQTVGTSYTQKVGSEHTTDVGGTHSLKVGGSSSVKVTGKRSEDFGSYSMSVKSGSSMTVSDGTRVDRTIGAWNATASSSIRMTAPSVSISSGGGGGMGAAAGGALSLKSKATLEGPSAAALKSGDSSVNADAKGVQSRGASVTAVDDAGGKSMLQDGTYVVDAPRGVTLRCGASELKLSPEGLYLNGRLINISAASTKIDTDRLDISGE